MIGKVWTGCIVLFWLTSMSWLFWHDVWPVWTAQEPPPAVTPAWLTPERMQQQARIEDKHGDRIGTIWTVYTRSDVRTTREDLILIERFPSINPIWLQAESAFGLGGQLEEMSATVSVPGLSLRLEGERFGSQMAFALDAGTLHQTFKVADADAGMIGDLFKPFSAMPDLRVGQAWRMKIFNPVAAVLGQGPRFIDLLVRVTGQDVVLSAGEVVNCLVVEAPNTRAWVGPDGVVHVQETELPVGGKIVIRREPFQERAMREARGLSISILEAEDLHRNVAPTGW
jgi:hypothetical protein